MGSTKNTKKCSVSNCKNSKKINPENGHIWSRFCTTHQSNATINAFLGKMYRDMLARVSGTKKGYVADRSKHIYLGKPILPRDVFMTWAKNHSDFLNLYKRYVMNNFDRKLAPSINRIDSKKGYTLDNMEWMTTSQNCGLSGMVIKMKNEERKMIYNILGVDNNVKK